MPQARALKFLINSGSRSRNLSKPLKGWAIKLAPLPLPFHAFPQRLRVLEYSSLSSEVPPQILTFSNQVHIVPLFYSSLPRVECCSLSTNPLHLHLSGGINESHSVVATLYRSNLSFAFSFRAVHSSGSRHQRWCRSLASSS